MKFSISRDSFLSALQLVVGVVERRQTLPVLSNALFVLEGSTLSITGTDMEVEIVSRVEPEQVEDGGSITIPARKLFDIIKSLREDSTVSVETDGERALVKSGRSRFSLSTLPASEFPALEEGGLGHRFTIPPQQFKQLIEKVAFAMAQQDVRYYLNGMLLELTSSHTRLVATDGHRLAMTTQESSDYDGEMVRSILPRKGVMELSRLLNDADDDQVDVQLSANHIRILAGRFRFTSKLVDGKFPEYERVLPNQSDKLVEADREELRQSFSRAAILSNEKYRGVRIQLDTGSIKITANNPEQEQAEEEASVVYQGEPLEIGFNVSYVLEALSAFKSEKIELSLSDPNTSALMTEKGDQTTLYVIMPMRL